MNIDRQLVETLPPKLRAELLSALHKVNHPMKDIIAKIPGENIREKAGRIPVTYQTMYLWQAERFRPVLRYALKISKLTGVPAEHIMEYRNDLGGTAAEEAAAVADGGQAAPKLHGRAGRAKQRVVEPQIRSRSVRKMWKRTGGRSGGAK